jgi:hypothetical protein
MGGRPDGLPEGVLTFLLTDIEGSTPLWERHRGVMGAALAQHEALITRAVAAHAGRLIKTKGEGDSTLSVFARASDAAAAALALQQLLVTERWPGAITLPTRPRCTPARPSCAAATTTDRRSTGPLGCGRSVRAARSCCRGRRPSWWPTSSRTAPGWSTSARTC